jgi:hypothetical protein
MFCEGSKLYIFLLSLAKYKEDCESGNISLFNLKCLALIWCGGKNNEKAE